MAKIIFNREECIGCGSCSALCPAFWDMADDMKATLKNAKLNNDNKPELEISEDNIPCNKDAVDCCPLQLIKII